MSDLSHMIWFLATAVMTITVLTGSTLAAAGMFSDRRRTGPRSRAPHRVGLSEVPAPDVVHGTQPTAPHQEHRAALPPRKESS